MHSGGRIPYPPVVNDLSLYNIGMEVATEMFQGDASKVTVADAPTMVHHHSTPVFMFYFVAFVECS